MGWLEDLFQSETKTVDTTGKTAPLPTFDQTTRAPWIEAIARNMGTSYFGSPTQGGMMSQPIPIPMQQIAGLSPQEIQARNLAGGLGGFGGQLNEAQRMYRQGSRQFNPNEARPYMDQGARNLYGSSYDQFGGGFDDPSIRGMYGQSTQGFNPQSTQNYMNPYEDSVVQKTMRDIRESGARSDIGRRGAEIGSGSFGGSRSRLTQGESDRSLNRGLMDAVGGIRSQGYQQAQQAAMGEFGRQQEARARAAQGMGQYGRQGQQIRQSAFEDAQRRKQQAASGMGGLSSDAFGQALNAYQTGTANQRAGAGGISGLGQQGFDMLSNQIGTLGNLGSIGRGIQQKGFDSQYTAAKHMADEPWMRMQRGMQLLGGIAPYGATINQGYNSQLGSQAGYQQPSSFMGGLAALSSLKNLFGN
tara:strand:- start:9267 stop:10511 length:1245 start_codon:yes stop_codon:yes gene_type:complete